MANVFQRAQQRRAELQAEIERVDSFIAMYKTLDRDADNEPDDTDEIRVAKRSDLPTFTPAMSGLPMPDTRTKGSRGPRGSSPEEITAAAIKAVNEANRPMTRYELVDAVESQGLRVGGTDKPRNMGTILWRSGAFDNDGEGYRPKGWKPFDKDFDL